MDNNSDNNIYIIAGNLHLEPYEIKSLLELKIEHKMNEHSTFYLRGVLPNGIGSIYAETSAKGTPVTLNAVDNVGMDYVLFQGVVNHLEVHLVQEIYYLELYAVSYSYLLDITKKSRSFQDKKMPYANLIREVTKDYPNVAVIDIAPNGNPTNQFILQHEETDWEFLKRMASHFNTGLVSDARFKGAKYYFGVPQIQTIEFNYINYSVKKDLQRYRQLSQNNVDGLVEEDFIYFEVITRNIVNIGDCVKFNNRTLYVNSITSHADKGIFTNICVLTPKKAFTQNKRKHFEAVGASFSGSVL